MPNTTSPFILRRHLQEQPDALFVFGDNSLRRGFGGLAREMRGEPNAVGIITKKAPSMEYYAFLYDEDYDEWLQAAEIDFKRIEDHLIDKGLVVWPAGGIGTGLAKLPEKSPKIYNEIVRRILWFEARYGRIN